MRKLKPGDRIETNEAFAEKFPRNKVLPKTGVIVSENKKNSNRYNVLWDGWSHAEAIHVSFIELAEGGAA
jgi:hypothetical protein